MDRLLAALMAISAWSHAAVEPSEQAMRRAFAADLADGVRAAVAYVAQSGGEEALARMHAARTDEFEVRAVRKIACRAEENGPGHRCTFVVEVVTVAGPIERAIAGRFYPGPHGLAFADDA